MMAMTSWVDLCDEYSSSCSGDENLENSLKLDQDLLGNCNVQVKTCTTLKIEKEINIINEDNAPNKVMKEIATMNKIEVDIKGSNVCKDDTTPNKANNEKAGLKSAEDGDEETSPWRFSYATILKNSANKGNENATPHTPAKQTVEKKSEVLPAEQAGKSVKREIQREFVQDIQEDLSLSSHLDVFHMQSPLKLEAVDEEMASPVRADREKRAAKKRVCQPKLVLDDDAVMSDDVLMPSPKKVTRLSSRRKREPGESPLSKRSKNSSGVHNTPKCVVAVESPELELETDEQVLVRRQKQIDYGKNTIGYERYCQMVPKKKRHKKHPQTPPKHIKYSRRAWDGLIKVWRQQLHFWDPPSEGGGNIDDLDISLLSEASSDTTSQTSSLPPTPRDFKLRRSSRISHSSASESSSITDDAGCSPL